MTARWRRGGGRIRLLLAFRIGRRAWAARCSARPGRPVRIPRGRWPWRSSAFRSDRSDRNSRVAGPRGPGCRACSSASSAKPRSRLLPPVRTIPAARSVEVAGSLQFDGEGFEDLLCPRLENFVDVDERHALLRLRAEGLQFDGVVHVGSPGRHMRRRTRISRARRSPMGSGARGRGRASGANPRPGCTPCARSNLRRRPPAKSCCRRYRRPQHPAAAPVLQQRSSMKRAIRARCRPPGRPRPRRTSSGSVQRSRRP